MAINPYFSQGAKSEQDLYEDIVIESMKIYGQDVYYIPRDIVNEDKILGDDIPSRFNSAYKVEMYLENTEGFMGEGDIFTKFGIELRDTANFIVSRRRWEQTVQRYDNEITTIRPAEGDLIYLPLASTTFEITAVQHENTFYQLRNITTYRITAQLFEYNDEQMDTGIPDIDEVENLGYVAVLNMSDSATASFEIGERVTQSLGNGIIINGEVVAWDEVTNTLRLAHIGSNSPDHLSFRAGLATGSTTGVNRRIISVGEDLAGATERNDEFRIEGGDFIDFTELNPFGDPER